ncbi:hypothetical protein GE061_004478 [Apolygus lucorum]|uniref:Uncharacterized protein n=1 Tax=Apolygus lucorum TaxID=248454 RepID=A0A6A4J7F8_APOLU|nr:hypothetical protein GE061_004478 [Apolygus lucorum]
MPDGLHLLHFLINIAFYPQLSRQPHDSVSAKEVRSTLQYQSPRPLVVGNRHKMLIRSIILSLLAVTIGLEASKPIIPDKYCLNKKKPNPNCYCIRRVWHVPPEYKWRCPRDRIVFF